MPIKLKQPLRLADNLTAFDPQAPLILSADMLSRISIPIADRTAVPGQPVGRGRIVSGIARRGRATSTIVAGVIYTETHEFNSAAEFFNFEPVGWSNPLFIRSTSTGGPFIINWYHGISGSDLLMSWPESEYQLVQHPTRKIRMNCTGFPGTIWITLLSFYIL